MKNFYKNLKEYTTNIINYGITSYPYGRKAVKVSKTELLQYLKSKI